MKPIKSNEPKITTKESDFGSGFRPPNANKSVFEFVLLDETQAQIMVVLFIISAFITVFTFNSTVITILESSKIFALFTSAGFILAFVARTKLNLSVIDGLFYGGFGLAPIGLAGLLLINSFGTEILTEKYKIADRVQEGTGYTFTLENDALESYWHIRNLHRDEVNGATGFLEYTFREGVFGYKYMLSREVKRD